MTRQAGAVRLAGRGPGSARLAPLQAAHLLL